MSSLGDGIFYSLMTATLNGLVSSELGHPIPVASPLM
jgi:hypothetical protein